MIKESCNWLDESILARNLWIKNFLNMKFAQENRTTMFLQLGCFQQKVA